MLHNVYAALVGELGFNADAATNPDGTEGNVVFMHLMIDALALQPCNPTLYVHPHLAKAFPVIYSLLSA
jgi:extracellular elastinolytic metalloproteinase